MLAMMKMTTKSSRNLDRLFEKKFSTKNKLSSEFIYEECLKSNGIGSINVLFYLTSKLYNMSPSK